MGRNSSKRGASYSSTPPREFAKYGWGRCPSCGSTTEPQDGVCFVCGCPATWRQIERSHDRAFTFNPCPGYPTRQQRKKEDRERLAP